MLAARSPPPRQASCSSPFPVSSSRDTRTSTEFQNTRCAASIRFVFAFRSNQRTVCDVINEDASLEVHTMENVLSAYRIEATVLSGRTRSEMLPADVADRLQVLRMPDSLVQRLETKIPLHRRKMLERRRRARKTTEPNKPRQRRGSPLLARKEGGKQGGAELAEGTPRERKQGSLGDSGMVGGGRGHRRGIPRRGFPK